MRAGDSDAWAMSVDSDHLRLRLHRSSDRRYRFTTEIVEAGQSRPGASTANVPVGGGLDLAADHVEEDGDGLKLSGRGRGRDPDGQLVDYDWFATVRPCAGGGIAFEAVVDLAGCLADPPAIELWLGPLSTTADRQTQTWRRSFVGGPVRNTQGLPGNSVPAAYLFDPGTGVESTLHVDASALAWAPGRLIGLELRELFDYGASPRYGVGLVPSRRFTLPAGRHVFRWRLWQRGVEATPDGWQASARLVDNLSVGLDGVGSEAIGAAAWERLAAGTVTDLLDPHQVPLRIGGEQVLGLRAYVRDAAHYYDQADDHIELMTVADIVPPLLLYLRLHPDDEAARLADALRQTLLRFGRPEAGYISNRFPTDGVEPVTDTWYFFLNGLIKLPWVALIEADPSIARLVRAGLRGAARLAQMTHDRLPLFADFRPDSGPRPLGAAPNPSVAGLLAYAALQAAQLGAEGGRELATRLLLGLRRDRVELAFHEPLQLGFAAAAAARLAAAGDQHMDSLADAFVRAQLRMLYWDEDPEAERNGYRVRGMFEACASLLYPAFKENVEAILPWTVVLRTGRGPTELMLKVMNLIRLHSVAFFDPLLPDPKGGAAPWIPYENLGTTELPGTGSIGKEVYGAGEVLWAYLVFEALARVDDPAVLLVYADLLEPESLRGFPLQRRRFIAYNPTAETRTFLLTGRALTSNRYHLSFRKGIVGRESLLAGVPLTLPAHAWRTIDLEEVPG